MGTDVSAFAFVGIPVQERDFLVEVADNQETCPEGHVRKEGTGTFCDQDGGRFRLRIRKLPTEGLRRLCAHLDWVDKLTGADANWEANYKELVSDKMLVCNGRLSRNDGNSVLTTGTRLSTGSHRDANRRLIFWDEAEILEQFAAVSKMVEAMGLTGRVPALYLQQTS